MVMLRMRFRAASLVAVGDTSTPWMWRDGRGGQSRACSRRGMQPVPVQRSRMRRVRGGVEGAERRKEARWVVMFSVSGLVCKCRC